MKNDNPTSLASPSGPNSSIGIWWAAARPRTWVISLSPVCIGTILAGSVDSVLFALTLLFALSIQIGTNYANDYFDFIKGADTKERIGPVRATAAGLITPAAMQKAMWIAFAAAGLFALPLMMRVGLRSLPLAALCVLFGVLYTGGPKPLGYLGLGELLVLIFFGPVACCGAYYVQTFSLNGHVFLASLAPGLFAVAVLVANNLRDWETDKKAGKRTLIVRWGKRFGMWEYALSVVFAGLVPVLLAALYGASMLPSLALLAAVPAIYKAFTYVHPKELIPVLQKTALVLLLYTLLFCLTV